VGRTRLFVRLVSTYEFFDKPVTFLALSSAVEAPQYPIILVMANENVIYTMNGSYRICPLLVFFLVYLLHGAVLHGRSVGRVCNLLVATSRYPL
jgi:hypothetical protein